MSLMFGAKVWINIIPALVQITACRLFGAKTLSEPVMGLFAGAYMHHSALMS